MKNDTIISFGKTIIIALLLALFIRNFVFNISQVKGHSMDPTFHENDKLICLAYARYLPIERGSIVVIQAPGEKRKFIKRIVGLPGDQFMLSSGKVYINGKPLSEPYTSTDETLPLNTAPITLSQNQYFVLGDNRLPGASEDSRAFGPIEKKNIKSVVFYRFYPFNQMKKF